MDWIDETLEKVTRKMAVVAERNADKIPYTTDEDGHYDDRSDNSVEWSLDDGLNWWTNGFWGGLMWLMYQQTHDDKYVEIARNCEQKLSKAFDGFMGLHHDVGFMFVPTAVADYKLTGNESSRQLAMHAANILAGRFNPVGKFIRAWNDLEDDTRGWAIIDCMFNISLLYWAYEETKDPRFLHIATMHANTVQEYFVRPDGSVNHIVEFDPFDGHFVRSLGGQGYGEGSSWSRGQGWALYGFTISYLHTQDENYLNTAKKVAHYCMANIDESGIIPVDFRQPKEPAYEDSCGACVIAGGLIELAKCLPELERDIYIKAAEKILMAISENRADFSHETDAIVLNCTPAYGSAKKHITMNYADYYYIEALQKLKNIGTLIW